MSEIAWAAGLFEGEGSACYRMQKGRRYGVACLAMNDQETVERFARAVGCGNLNGPYLNAKHPDWAARWVWQTGRRDAIERVLLLLRPYLSQRRIAQLESALP